jgi:hypothetical protein
MNSAPTALYSRLPGRRLGIAQRASLWLGPDHVLVVHETMTGESYRRFFFRDIRSITIRPTRRRESASTALLALAVVNLLPLLFLTASEPETRAISVFAGGSLLWIGLLVANVLRGPSCETRFSTMAQDDIVAPLSRTRTARRVVAQLRPRILAAQSGEAPVASPVTGDVTS